MMFLLRSVVNRSVASPVIARVSGNLEPPPVHIERAGAEAKFWLRPQVRMAYNDGFDGKTLRELPDLVEANREAHRDRVAEVFRSGRRASALTRTTSGSGCPTGACSGCRS